ncbi:hypothetical protein [Sphingobium sp. D43FB]|nr:hypothetical protein [Sphingobium sp. D43FB]
MDDDLDDLSREELIALARQMRRRQPVLSGTQPAGAATMRI